MSLTLNPTAHVEGIATGGQRWQFHRLYEQALWQAPWKAPLYRELRDGRVLLCEPGPKEALPDLERFDQPLVVLADDARWNRGQHGWRSIVALIRWAAGNVVIADEQPLDDELVEPLQRAQTTGGLLIVATTAECAADFQDLALRANQETPISEVRSGLRILPETARDRRSERRRAEFGGEGYPAGG